MFCKLLLVSMLTDYCCDYVVGRSQAVLVTINWNCKVEVRRIPGLNPIAIIREPKGLVTGCSRLCLMLSIEVDFAYHCYLACFEKWNMLS